MMRYIGQVLSKGLSVLMEFEAQTGLPQGSILFPQPRSSLNLILYVFMEALSYRHY